MIRKLSIKSKVLSAVAVGMISFSALQPAYAIFGVGDVVLDPSNLVQNIMTAARALQMVNNQIRQLQNEAQSLINEAKNLAPLNFSDLNQLRATLAATQQLFAQAQGMSFNLSQMQATFARLYPATYAATMTSAQMDTDRQAQWSNSREALSTALQMQSQATQNFSADEAVMSDVIGHSQSSEGALQAVQATNQLLALQARQLMQAQQLQISQDRAVALEQARAVAEEERARELRRRFMIPAPPYHPAPVASF